MFIKQINAQTGEVSKVELTAEEVSILQPPRVFTEKEQRGNRASAYAAEADPLFFQAQRGEATMDEWTAKVAEIRTRYPYPGDAE